MKKWIFSIVVVSIVSILIVGCTTVGAVNFPVNLKNDENKIENINPDKIENIDNNKVADVDKTDEEIINEADKEPEEPDNDNKEELENKEPIIESKIHYTGNKDKKLVALTFDDGPESKYTGQILEILDEYNIKATFFVIGQNAEKHPEALKSIYDKGHEIGNHTWSHKYLPKLSKQGIEKEILMTEKAITDIIGEHNSVFRPPYGALKTRDLEIANTLGYNAVNWSVDTKDWAGTTGEQMMKYVKEQLTPGGIILMHNGGNPRSIRNTVDTLPTLIEWVKEQGYQCVTVSEILDL